MANEDFDLTQLGLSPEETLEFVRQTLTPQKAAEFKKQQQNNSLREQYVKELSAIKGNMAIKQIAELKARYRRLGLPIY